ncbi:MAG: hypothetical protein HOQ00_05230 [Agromyces sp.]|nr:hypothetical protein [Agromyces sp.]
MSDQFATKRPLGVTIVAALSIIAGIIDVFAGIMLLAVQVDPEVVEQMGGSGLVVTAAIFALLLGAAMIIIAFGLLRGNAIARIAATVVQVVSLAQSIWLAVVDPALLTSEILGVLLAIALLILLWSGEASRYFKGLAPDEPTA